MIYLDNSATTRIDDEVLQEMMPWLTENYGNPGGRYPLGEIARAAVDKAREQVAEYVNLSDPSGVVFTSGGSEANSLAILGYNHRRGGFTISSHLEHDSVYNSVLSLTAGMSGGITRIDTHRSRGVITPESFYPPVIPVDMITLMCVNNETGVCTDVATVAQEMRRAYGTPIIHVDCVQATIPGMIDMDAWNECGISSASISSHKINGPKGMGALCLNKPYVTSIIKGSKSQENGYRGGTENVAGIVGFGKACELMHNERSVKEKYETLSDAFMNALANHEHAKTIERNTFGTEKHKAEIVPNILSLYVPGVDAQTLIMMAGVLGLCISAGSACNSFETTPSRVLINSGLTPERASHTIRVSFGKYNTVGEMIEAAAILEKCIKELS